MGQSEKIGILHLKPVLKKPQNVKNAIFENNFLNMKSFRQTKKFSVNITDCDQIGIASSWNSKF